VTPGQGEWIRLVEESWTLAPGGEAPRWCGTKILTEDVYISAIRPVHPPGTHHTTVSLAPNDGQTDCNPIRTIFENGLIYAAGVGTEALHLPDGVAMRLPAGMVVNLGLHLYNPTPDEISGTSAIEVLVMDPADVEHESETFLAGPISLDIPVGTSTVTHNCSITQETTVFALFPHMHQLGAHMKSSLTIGGVPTVLHDADYSFEEQVQLPIGPYLLRPGDTVTTECTYENATGRTVGFGESSDTEMCFSILFRYPPTGSAFCFN
jgi:hypothetical protein